MRAKCSSPCTVSIGMWRRLSGWLIFGPRECGRESAREREKTDRQALCRKGDEYKWPEKEQDVARSSSIQKIYHILAASVSPGKVLQSRIMLLEIPLSFNRAISLWTRVAASSVYKALLLGAVEPAPKLTDLLQVTACHCNDTGQGSYHMIS